MQFRSSVAVLPPLSTRKLVAGGGRQGHAPTSNFLSPWHFCTSVATSVQWGYPVELCHKISSPKGDTGNVCLAELGALRGWSAELEDGPRKSHFDQVLVFPSSALVPFSLSDMSDFLCGMRWWDSVIFFLNSLWPKPDPLIRVWLCGGWGIPHKERHIGRSDRAVSPNPGPSFYTDSPWNKSGGHEASSLCWVLRAWP